MAVTSAKTPFLAFKIAVLLIAFFTFLAWVLLLGGISALEAVCNGGCRSLYGLPWFIIWFQFILIVPAIAIEFLNRSLWRQTVNLLLAINTTLAIIQADRFLNIKDAGFKGSRINATIAGFIILAIFNLLLLILSGSRTALETRYGEDRDVGVATYPSKTRPTTPGPSAAQVTVPPPQSSYAAGPNAV